MSDSSSVSDRLPELTARLDSLDGLPIAEHPDLLEDVHRAVVGELEALGSGRGLGGPVTTVTARGR